LFSFRKISNVKYLFTKLCHARTQHLARTEQLWTLKENPEHLVWLGNFLCLLFSYMQNKFAFYLIFSSIKSVLSGKSQAIQINNSETFLTSPLTQSEKLYFIVAYRAEGLPSGWGVSPGFRTSVLNSSQHYRPPKGPCSSLLDTDSI